jgi:hypothetical protein
MAFISHADEDKKIAIEIAGELRKRGMATFCSAEDREAGAWILDLVRDNLIDSGYFLILISKSSMKSDWVKYELGGAMFRRPYMRIIPILIGIAPPRMPEPIAQIVGYRYEEIEAFYRKVEQWRELQESVKQQISAQEKVLARRTPRPVALERLRGSFLEQQLQKGVSATAPAFADVMRSAGMFARTGRRPAGVSGKSVRQSRRPKGGQR